MKKNLIFLLSAALMVLATGCEKTSKGLTRITYYPVITLQGDNPYVVQLGENYSEPGFTASLNGEDYTSNVQISSNVDSSVPGIYSVTYSATNPDGCSYSTTRDVYVLNPGGIANVYLSHCWMGTRDYTDLPIVISPVSDVKTVPSTSGKLATGTLKVPSIIATSQVATILKPASLITTSTVSVLLSLLSPFKH